MAKKKPSGKPKQRPAKPPFRLPKIEITRGRFILLLALILSAGWLHRINDLGADPPGALSWSQGPFTDGAVVLHDVRNKVLHGEWIRDYCEDMYLFPLSNAFAYPFMKIFGVGRWQAALPNTILGMLTILIFAVALLPQGRGRALLWALLASLSYFLIHFHRIPIAEPAMVFLMASAFLFYSLAEKKPAMIFLAGVLAGAAPLFGKAHAFYFPVVLLASIFFTETSRSDKISRLRLASLGIVVAVLFWTVFLLLPHGDYILSHITHESVGKHAGGTGGFLREFLQNLFAMGSYTNMFEVMPVLTALAILGLFGTLRAGKNLFQGEHRITSFLVLWLSIGWIALAAVRLPAPRYLTALAFPMLFFALRPIFALLEGKPLSWNFPRSWREMAAGIAALIFIIYQPFIHTGMKTVQFLKSQSWGKGIHDFFIGDDAYAELVIFCAAETLIVVAVVLIVLFLIRPKQIRLSITAASGTIIAVILILGSLSFNVGKYWQWTMFRSHYLRDASRDMTEWLGPDARLMGSFAPALGLDNTFSVFPYFGGLGDEDVLRKYGITHVIVSSKGDFDFLQKNYPSAHEGKEKVLAYPVKSRYTSVMAIYRLPKVLDGQVVHSYEPTLFERAVQTATGGEWAEALTQLREYLRDFPENADAHYLVGFMYNQMGEKTRAADSFRKAIDLRGERPRYYEELAKVYRSLGRTSEAIQLMEHAYRLNPRDKLVQGEIQKMGGQFQ